MLQGGCRRRSIGSSKWKRAVVIVMGGRVENGMGKSHPDRLRLPSEPAINCFLGKNKKTGEKMGKRAGTGTESVGVFFRPFSRGKIPAGIPGFVGLNHNFSPISNSNLRPAQASPRPKRPNRPTLDRPLPQTLTILPNPTPLSSRCRLPRPSRPAAGRRTQLGLTSPRRPPHSPVPSPSKIARPAAPKS